MRWLLQAFVSDADRRAIENDLAELYEFHRRRDGDRAAARWLRRQLLLYPLHVVMDRLRALRPMTGGPGVLMRDILHSARSLARTPALTLTIVLTIGIGVGATTAMVSVIRAVIVNPLPYAHSNALVNVYSDRPPYHAPFSVVDYRALEADHPAFEAVAGSQSLRVTHTTGGMAEQVKAKAVTGSYFPLLGLTPLYGRLIDPSDDTPGHQPVVLSYAFWANHFGSDASALGRAITLDGAPYTIVGVLPARSGPLEHDVALFTAAHWPTPTRRGPFFISVIGRLQPTVSSAAALETLHATNHRLFPIWRTSFQDETATWGLLDLKARILGDVESTLLFLLGAVACVLLIACANAINLLIARAMHRGRELAIRSALGASRRRILLHLMAEGVVLTVGSALVGLALTAGALSLITTYGAAYLPRIEEIRLSGRVLAWLAGLSAASGLLVGLVPAMQSSRPHVDRALRSGGRSVTDGPAGRRIRRALVAAEFAIATPLVVAAALVGGSLQNLQHVNVGIDTRRVLTAGLSLPTGQYPQDADAHAFWVQALARLARLPGVESVALADSRPPRDIWQENNIDLEDHPTPPGRLQPTSPWVAVSPNFFKTVGLGLQQGRLLDEHDYVDTAPPVVVVDRAWAARFFPNEQVLGRRFQEGGCTTCPWTTVVGVVGTVKYLGLDAPDQGTVYWPALDRFRQRYFMVRAAGDAGALGPMLRQAVRELDPSIALSSVATIEELASDSLSEPRYLSVIVGIFAVTALVLSVVGIYGVMSYFVQQHRRDIGIRLALGGDPSRVGRMVVTQGLRLVMVGVAAGVCCAFWSGRLMQTVLFGVSATDARTIALVPGVLLAVAIVACLIPARRAAAVNPADILRDSS